MMRQWVLFNDAVALLRSRVQSPRDGDRLAAVPFALFDALTTTDAGGLSTPADFTVDAAKQMLSISDIQI
jgi:hypothetical protein